MVEVTRAPDYPDHSLPLFLRITAQPPGYNGCADKSYQQDRAHKQNRFAKRTRNIFILDSEKIESTYEKMSEALGISESSLRKKIKDGNGATNIQGHEVVYPSYKAKVKTIS